MDTPMSAETKPKRQRMCIKCSGATSDLVCAQCMSAAETGVANADNLLRKFMKQLDTEAQWESFHSLWFLLYLGRMHSDMIYDERKLSADQGQVLDADLHTIAPLKRSHFTIRKYKRNEIWAQIIDIRSAFATGDLMCAVTFLEAYFLYRWCDRKTQKWVRELKSFLHPPITRRRVKTGKRRSVTVEQRRVSIFNRKTGADLDTSLKTRIPAGIRRSSKEKIATHQIKWEWAQIEKDGRKFDAIIGSQYTVNGKIPMSERIPAPTAQESTLTDGEDLSAWFTKEFNAGADQ